MMLHDLFVFLKPFVLSEVEFVW